jgi:hypothetical protein
VPDPILPTSGTLQIFAQADTYLGQPGTTIYGTPDHGRILEGDELNNIGGPVEIYLNPSVYLPLLRK